MRETTAGRVRPADRSHEVTAFGFSETCSLQVIPAAEAAEHAAGWSPRSSTAPRAGSKYGRGWSGGLKPERARAHGLTLSQQIRGK